MCPLLNNLLLMSETNDVFTFKNSSFVCSPFDRSIGFSSTSIQSASISNNTLRTGGLRLSKYNTGFIMIEGGQPE